MPPGCLRDRWVNSGVVGFIRGGWVPLGAPYGSSGSFGVVGLMWVRPGGLRVNSWSLGSFVCALGVVGFIRDRWVHWLSTPWVSSGSFGSVGFTGVRPGGRPVHSRSLGSLGCALLVVGFIRGR